MLNAFEASVDDVVAGLGDLADAMDPLVDAFTGACKTETSGPLPLPIKLRRIGTTLLKNIRVPFLVGKQDA